MRSKIAKMIAEEIFYKEYKCPYCERIVPNFSFLTKTKCIWCDDIYWNKKQKRKVKA